MPPNFTPRPSQSEILAYRGGKLGISAVPGSGKTHTLSALAAEIIARGELGPDQEVLIVTLVNSAVDNFSSRVSGFIQEHGLLPHIGYRVRTLHGLAHDIVREKPALVGLEERFSIIDEREADFIRKEAAQAWLHAHPYALDDYLDPAMDDSKRDWVRRQQLPELVDSLALSFIRSAKDRRLSPEDLRLALDRQPAAPVPGGGLPLVEMGWEIYANYQRALTYRGAVDFDDLIRLALRLLELDAEFLERLRYRWPYILEDEAQDSSQLQEQILRLLSGSEGNWVRVGDPNQAIFETFTTASPELLRRFIAENPHVDMAESGRSQQSIIDLANHLIDWVMDAHPIPEARTALSLPHIEPVPEGYEPANPPDNPEAIRFISKKYTPEEELEAVVKSVKGFVDSIKDLPIEQQPTIAVLTTINDRGTDLYKKLREKGVDAIEMLKSTEKTRTTAGSISYLLSYLSDPQSARKLSKAYEVFRRDWREDVEKMELVKGTGDLIRRVGEVEKFIAPSQADDWLATIGESEAEHVIQELTEFRVNVQRWLNAVTLPIDQLVLTLAQDVFSEASDLALAHKLALVLRQAANDHADWRLPELTSELAVIAKNERRFIGFSPDDSGFDPERHRGKVVVTTMHKAKGLEWERVYLMSVNNYDFPSLQPYDRYIAEKWFVRGVSTLPSVATTRLNLEAEALAQLESLGTSNEYEWYEEGAATQKARLDYVKERLRLFYVGITRAKKDLIVTWNSGRQGDATPSLAMSALMGWWESIE